jgi:hypothetical protein
VQDLCSSRSGGKSQTPLCFPNTHREHAWKGMVSWLTGYPDELIKDFSRWWSLITFPTPLPSWSMAHISYQCPLLDPFIFGLVAPAEEGARRSGRW